MTEKELRKKAMALPLQPGVYIMKNKDRKIIYIGKAKKLKNRVSSYFGSHSNHSLKVIRMVENVDDFDYILCDSEFEALVLECSLIKQHQPKYNILLKDDKGYNYIKITKEEFPRIRECKQMLEDDAVYIGPYTSNFSVKQAVEETLKIFKLPRCNKQFPRDYGKSRPCLNGFMGLCSAPCAKKITKEEYIKNINDAVAFLKGGSVKAVRQMQQKMEKLAENLQFEEAAKLRDRIKSIKNLEEKQKVVSINVPEEDVFALVNSNKKACFEVIRFEHGKLTDSEFWLMDAVDNLPQSRFELIERYYSMRQRIPARIAVDGDIEDEALLKEFLESLRGKKIEFIHPQKGEHLSIVNMCIKNASEHLAQQQGRLGKELAALEELKNLLGLKKIPEYIESYDISHTFGADNVAGMVVFHNGRPMKSAYKRFSINGFDGQNDVGSMQEVLTRRFNHYYNDEEGSTFKILPDLILLDGGEPQVNAVLPVINSMGLNVAVFGMVKDSKHRTRAIALNGGEIEINSHRSVFTLVSSIQEEVHRFAITYHHKKHKKSTLSTSLTKIKGIGDSKARALMKHFKTVTKIKEADVEELREVPSITEKNAQEIYNFYHNL
ncbi:MAG: excinuclease ABC subunit UvrC [Acetobacter sp.]|nr:excinuclease ABC subunit UvrC [Bacteroides sp.]MCM1341595.1 excinuclease ABC subunit UvrC [Acetobacter sp.]MCM1433672.1 excinuclease ABC subunit UvrC [Clostridiales bacterium]